MLNLKTVEIFKSDYRLLGKILENYEYDYLKHFVH